MNARDGNRRKQAEINRCGGEQRKCAPSHEDAQEVVRIREARLAFRQYHAQCFWFMREDMQISATDIPEIAKGLRLHGGHRGMELAERLCR